jgi:hypothetical protein
VAATLSALVILGVAVAPTAGGDGFFHKHFRHLDIPPGQIETMNGGYWMWVRSPEQEKVVVMSLYNRYCIRCHGVDGRGVWDIPGIPDFSNIRWQTCRTDDQIVRIILEGRGAVMPPFRGALSIEEAWGIAHYLRSFVPGTEVPKPDLRAPASGSMPAGSRTAPPPPPPAATITPASPPAAAPAPTPRPAIPPPAPFRSTTGLPSGS